VFWCGTDAESVSEVDRLGRGCVIYAVHFRQFDTLQILLENGANVNQQSHGLLIALSVTAYYTAC